MRNDVGEMFVQLFDATLANWCGVPPGICSLAPVCGHSAVMEHNGDIYPCDHFVYPNYKLGNIKESSLEDIVSSEKITRFGIDKRNMLPNVCLRCKYYFACRGECPKHRFTRSDKNEPGLNSLCEGLYYFFSHVEPYMLKMKDMILDGKEAKFIMECELK